ncbi:hypothetical protein HDR60_02380 [bacterium]|nr:hypothetical protein [bacterium]
MKVIENAQLNNLIKLFNYHRDRVAEYSANKKFFDLRNFYNYLPRSFKNDKNFLQLHILMHLANEIEKNHILSQNDFETLQNKFWSPMSKILLQVNEK